MLYSVNDHGNCLRCMENTGAFFITVAYPADKVNLKVNPKLFVSDKVFVIFGLGAGLSITAIFVYTYYTERFYHFCTMLTLFITLFFHEHQKNKNICDEILSFLKLKFVAYFYDFYEKNFLILMYLCSMHALNKRLKRILKIAGRI